MTTEQITAIEAAIAAFAPDSTDLTFTVTALERGCLQYSQLLRQQNPDASNIQLAKLKNITAEAYARVLAVLPAQKRTEVTEFVDSYAGKELPTISAAVKVSEAPVISLPVKPTPIVRKTGKG